MTTLTQPIQSIKPPKLFALSLATVCLLCPILWEAEASTTMDYKSPCEYYDSNGKLLSTTCIVNFGIIGLDRGMRYVLTFENKTEVWIYYLTEGDKTTANNIPADIAFGNHKVVVVTEQGEIFIFNNYHGKEAIFDPPISGL